MARLVYRPDHPGANENGMVDIEVAGPRVESGSAPNVISDEMDPTRHMCDGRMFTSKAAFRAHTRAHGCIEIGNETKTMLEPRKPVQLDRQQRREAIRQSIRELRGQR